MSRGEILHDVWTRYNKAPPVPMATASIPVTVGLFADGFESGDTDRLVRDRALTRRRTPRPIALFVWPP